MSLDYKIEAIEVWPGEKTPSYQRKRSPFKTIWTSVITHLEREIRQLGGRNVVFRLQVTQWDVNLNGTLRANARIREPGVIIQFAAGRLKGAPTLLYRCDRFPFWQDNVSAIARGLEALRLVDRYGVTPTGEQYAGFKALPSNTSPTLSTTAAAEIIGSFAPEASVVAIASDPATAKYAVRIAIHKTHPDRNNGGRADYDRVDAARRVLSSVHGISL